MLSAQTGKFGNPQSTLPPGNVARPCSLPPPGTPGTPHTAHPLPQGTRSPSAGRNLEGPSTPRGPRVSTSSTWVFSTFPSCCSSQGQRAAGPLPRRARLEGGFAACWRQTSGKGHSDRDPLVFPLQDWLHSPETPRKASCQPSRFSWAQGVSPGALARVPWSLETPLTWPCSLLRLQGEGGEAAPAPARPDVTLSSPVRPATGGSTSSPLRPGSGGTA